VTPTTQPTLPIRRIVQGKNPREYFDPDEMAELEEGIRAVGVLEPIVVRPVPGTDLYEIIAGERRWRAAKNVFGDDYDMPVVIKDASDETAEAMSVIENYHRAAMSPAEEARAAQRQLLRQRGDKEETARLMGWSPEVLERRLALMACTPTVLKALTTRSIQLGHAELLSGIPPEKQDSVLAGVLAQKVPVAVLKAQLGRFARRLADAIFDTAQCSGCTHNSARQAGLFAESLGEGYCQHPSHFEELTLQAVQARADALLDLVLQLYAPLPAASLGYLTSLLGYGAPQLRAEARAALKRLPQRQPHALVEGERWFWPDGENPASRRHRVEPERLRWLAPFDPLVWDRRRFERFWGWAYRFEAYTPAAKRTMGHYALPLLWGEQVVGWANLKVSDGCLVPELGFVGPRPRGAVFEQALQQAEQHTADFLGLQA